VSGGSKSGLLVDFGGVLTTNVFQSFKSFCHREGLQEDTIKEIFRDRDGDGLALLRRLERGEIDSDQFADRFAPLIGVDDSDGLVERLFADMGPDDRMLDAVRAARDAGVKTGLISNSWGSGLAYDQELLDQLFDCVVISGDVGLHKPEPEIYELAASQIGVEPGDCVFVDDLRENCAGAEEVGMTAILHRGADGTLPKLAELLGVDLT
jgi:epoxide hydrolase-like predicted phosphatase